MRWGSSAPIEDGDIGSEVVPENYSSYWPEWAREHEIHVWPGTWNLQWMLFERERK
jgi:hypothetical protein